MIVAKDKTSLIMKPNKAVHKGKSGIKISNENSKKLFNLLIQYMQKRNDSESNLLNQQSVLNKF
jgi:hypothetical protein